MLKRVKGRLLAIIYDKFLDEFDFCAYPTDTNAEFRPTRGHVHAPVKFAECCPYRVPAYKAGKVQTLRCLRSLHSAHRISTEWGSNVCFNVSFLEQLKEFL